MKRRADIKLRMLKIGFCMGLSFLYVLISLFNWNEQYIEDGCVDFTKLQQQELLFTEYRHPLHVDMPKLVTEFKQRHGVVKVTPINEYPYKILSGFPGEGSEQLNLLIIVKSAVRNYEMRAAIRETWGNQTYLNQLHTKVLFLVGTINNRKVLKHINKELKENDDIVQIGFTDTYLNNTLKTIGAIRFATQYYKHAKFLMLADDDFYIAINCLVKNLLSYPSSSLDSFYVGNIGIRNVSRETNYKWSLPIIDYPYNCFPPFVRTGAMVMSMQVAIDVDIASRFTKLFKFDDVFLGMVVYKLGIKPIHEPKIRINKAGINTYMFHGILASHGYSNKRELRAAWEKHIFLTERTASICVQNLVYWFHKTV